ncbi:hypothetical protein TNCV_4439981 [Trichonephila clavipes]|nr:hypothetical protein TNCV_4439981 [Trichonephila clavipes]
MLKRRARQITTTFTGENPEDLSLVTYFSLELPGSPRINENEGGLRTKKLRVNDKMVEIEQGSSHKLDVELPNSEVLL